jgi:hypothetical protein
MHGLSLFVLVVAAFTFSVVVDVHDLVPGVWFCKCLLSLSPSLVAAAVASHRPECLMPRSHSLAALERTDCRASVSSIYSAIRL